ncbi:MAG: OmcA/MtrC family decaheme c-type cytochrome [Anaeromyxobacter sp.]
MQVTIDQVENTQALVGTRVVFTVKDQDGNALEALPSGVSVYAIVAKLQADGTWKSYISRVQNGSTTDSLGNTYVPVLPQAVQANTQNVTSGVVAMGEGMFHVDIAAAGTTVDPVEYEPTRTHRVALEIRGNGQPDVNAVKDYVPADPTAAPTVTRNIVATETCKSCHATTFSFHGGHRYLAEYCVTCHNPGTVDPDGGWSLDMPVMTHRIHGGEELAAGFTAKGYTVYGYGNTKYDFSEVAYPMQLTSCTKCHSASDATPDGDNWKANANAAACSSCHIDYGLDLTSHHGNGDVTEMACTGCHGANAVANYHKTPYSTPNNPEPKDGMSTFEYVIDSVTVNGSRQAVFRFKILQDGQAVTLNTFAAGGTVIINGFTGGPSFYAAYAIPQGNVLAPADFNGAASGLIGTSPPSVSLTNLWNGTQGSLVADTDGFYVATLNGSAGAAVLPATAKMVTGVMIGSFTQTNGEAAMNYDFNHDGDTADAVLAISKSVKKVATGYTGRRQIISDAKCNSCHEQLGITPSFHGSVRNDADTCNVCHNPVRNSSSWSSGYKDFVHSLHAAGVRNYQFGWHADLQYWNVGYPNGVSDCTACHLDGTFDYSKVSEATLTSMLPSTGSSSNYVSNQPGGSAPATPPAVASHYLPTPLGDWADVGTDKSNNLVISPVTAACLGCHDSEAAVSHFRTQGGSVYAKRSLAGAEACLACHGPGKDFAIAKMHGQ